MKCTKCNAELSDDTKFCSYCGTKIEIPLKQEKTSEEYISQISSDKSVREFQNKKDIQKSLADKIKEKAISKWEELSMYGKIATVLIAIFTLLFFVALLSGKIAAIIIAVIQIALAVVAVLIHRGTIRIGQKELWLKWLLLGIAVLLIVLNMLSYSWNFESPNTSAYNDDTNTNDSVKYNAKIHIDFVPNLIFSKYDVNFLLNGVKKDSIPHGEDKDFEFSVAPGEYILTFVSDESSSVKGEVKLTIDSDVEASYKISCYSDKVSIETVYVDYLTELADGEVKLDVAASEYKHKNYEDVTTALKTLGFTNIKYEVLNDIVWGWTDNGEIESVSIADNKDFKRGDVFQSDAEIIITYHMPKEDNTKSSSEKATVQTGESSSSYQETSEKEAILTVENCPELAAILSNKADIDESYASFAKTYSGRTIEFDGRIDYCSKYEDKKTRFDYLVSAGDYDPDHQIGPAFKFENVSYYDLHTDLDTVSVGLNVHIVAVVKSFNKNNGLFYLKPVSVTKR